ncbi:MAG TPA: hypothetical protein VFC19_25645 [Candidatus Limnocylindrales bacterium]|nr:hypothetical protein [Candidatus Limnocylindrales bacterium]
MRVRPISRAGLVDLITGAIKPETTNVAIDGAPPARPGELAEAVVADLREQGRQAAHVRSADYLRPASLRFELGRTNPESYYERWVDLPALGREALNRSGWILPTFWNPRTDRATRAGYENADVVVLSGQLLLGAGLDLDLSIHLGMSMLVLRRKMPEELAWALPAFERYEDEVSPASFADIVVRMNDPEHPAVQGV